MEETRGSQEEDDPEEGNPEEEACPAEETSQSLSGLIPGCLNSSIRTLKALPKSLRRTKISFEHLNC